VHAGGGLGWDYRRASWVLRENKLDCEIDDAVEALSDLVLWDDDFLDDDAVLDLPTGGAAHRRERFGIDADYHVAIPPDPREKDISKIHTSLLALYHSDEHDGT
jgi:hypothetical protein